jgi:hypothetical protein
MYRSIPDDRSIIRKTIDGLDFVFVPVEDAGRAKLDAATADCLQAAGISLAGWHLGATGPDEAVSVCAGPVSAECYPGPVVARLILGVGLDSLVRYRNHDNFDLTEGNLYAVRRVRETAS